MPNTEEWGKGYDFGQIGMMKAIKTAEELGAANERSRIIKLLEESDIGRCCFESHDLIALIKGEK